MPPGDAPGPDPWPEDHDNPDEAEHGLPGGHPDTAPDGQPNAGDDHGRPGDHPGSGDDHGKPGDHAKPGDHGKPGEQGKTGPDQSQASGGQGEGESRGRWDVDLDRLHEFAAVVTSARAGLETVQTLVRQMQGDAYTPKLGTSPVGKQLARKFDDRLNSESGLRTLLAEAVRRMDEFIHGAEAVRDAYTEAEASAEAVLRKAGGDQEQGGR